MRKGWTLGKALLEHGSVVSVLLCGVKHGAWLNLVPRPGKGELNTGSYWRTLCLSEQAIKHLYKLIVKLISKDFSNFHCSFLFSYK